MPAITQAIGSDSDLRPQATSAMANSISSNGRASANVGIPAERAVCDLPCSTHDLAAAQ